MPTTVEIPIHGNARNKDTKVIDNPFYQNRPCVFVKLTYGEITRNGDQLSIDVDCVLQKLNRNYVYQSDNYLDTDNTNKFVGYNAYRLNVYAKLGDGDWVLLFKKPGSNWTGITFDDLDHTEKDSECPDQWETGDYEGSATLTEENSTTSTSLKLAVIWGCHNCESKGHRKTQWSAELTAPRKLYEYTVSYNANGGSNPPRSQTKIEDTDLTLQSTKPTGASANISLHANGGACNKSFVSASRKFRNWNTKSDGSGATYQAGGNYTVNKAVTLYAIWGGYVLPKLPTCTRDNCDFVGWYSGNTAVTKGSTISYSESPEIVARYSYHVDYDANGGTSVPESQVKTHGENLTLSSTEPARTGYTFLGWATTSTATSAKYKAGDIYTTDSPVTLYAVWRDNVYTVTFDYAGGKDAAGNASLSVEVGYGNDATAPVVTREGYYFTGWSGSYTDVTSNRRITAQWKRTRLHTVNSEGAWTGKATTDKFIYVREGGKWVQKLPLHEYNGTSWEELK